MYHTLYIGVAYVSRMPCLMMHCIVITMCLKIRGKVILKSHQH